MYKGRRIQCAGSFDKWLQALESGLLPHSHGALTTKDGLYWYEVMFSARENEVLEIMWSSADTFDVGRVIYTYDTPLAIELVGDDEKVLWVLNTRKYSRTSGKHRTFIKGVIQALAGENMISLEAFVAGAHLPIECRDTFMALLPEWHGSYDDLASAVVALS